MTAPPPSTNSAAATVAAAGPPLAPTAAAMAPAPRPSMGPSLDFAGSLVLMREMDRLAWRNYLASHKKQLLALMAGVGLLLGLVGWLAMVNSATEDKLYGRERDPRAEGRELEAYLADNPNVVYYVMVGSTLLVLPFWRLFFTQGSRMQALFQRRSGRLDFLYPAPLPAHIHFWHTAKRSLAAATIGPAAFTLIYGNMLPMGPLPLGLLLRSAYVIGCAAVAMAGLNLFFRYTLQEWPRPWPTRIPKLTKAVVYGALAVVAGRAWLENELGLRPWYDSLATSLINPAAQFLLAYPAAMGHIIAGGSPTPIAVLEGLLLGVIPALLILYLRLRPHHPHELPLLPGVMGLPLAWGPWGSAFRGPMEHRETLPLVRRRPWQKAWPPLPPWGKGLASYALMRLTLTLRGPVVIALIGGWAMQAVFIQMTRWVAAPTNQWQAEGLTLALVVVNLPLITLIAVAGLRNGLSATQAGLDRSLPIPPQPRYLLNLGLGTLPSLVYLIGSLPLLVWATHPFTSQAWQGLREESFILAGLLLLVVWTGLGPTAFFWAFMPDYRPGGSHTLFALGIFVGLGLLLVHLWWAATAGWEALRWRSLTLLGLVVLAGYYRYRTADVRT